MATHYNTRIVTDGLVLYLDAANPKSYPGTGTAWYDLSGLGNNVTLNTGVSFSSASGGKMIFDGTTAGHAYAATVNLPTSENATVLCWVNPDSTSANNTYAGLVSWGGRSGSTPSNSTLLSLNTTTTFYVSSAYWSNDYVPNNASVYANKDQWNMIGIISRSAPTTSNTTLLSFNSNGYSSITGSSSSYTKGISRTNVNLRIGCTDSSGARMVKGSISSVYIYNRELSSSELSTMTNALRGRYGI